MIILDSGRIIKRYINQMRTTLVPKPAPDSQQTEKRQPRPLAPSNIKPNEIPEIFVNPEPGTVQVLLSPTAEVPEPEEPTVDTQNTVVYLLTQIERA